MKIGDATTNWLERQLFPRSRLLDFVVIVCLSVCFSYLLTGRQIYLANWGLIDDHEVFTYLGPGLHLSPGNIWTTLLAKTEVGQLQGRFRPSFYFLKVLEASLLGANVHLWYLVNTACFALLLSSVWWTISRFVGLWLGGALTAFIALNPLWADIWSRLGPSEIFGAACVGVMLYCADVVLFSERSLARNVGAIALAVAAVVLAGLKETFVPLAVAAPAFVYILAVIKKQLSAILSVLLELGILISIAAIAFVVWRELHATGADYYGKFVGLGAILIFGIVGSFDAILRTWWLWALPVVFLRLLKAVPDKPLEEWIASSGAFGLYAFLIAMYAAQCAVYRMTFPHNSRYDFPAMLLVPLTCCILACEVSRRLRNHFPERVINYAQLTAAVFLVFALVNANLGRRRPLRRRSRKILRRPTRFLASCSAWCVPRKTLPISRSSSKRTVLRHTRVFFLCPRISGRSESEMLSRSEFIRTQDSREHFTTTFSRLCPIWKKATEEALLHCRTVWLPAPEDA
jgi:hypothetical protein